MGFVQSKDSQTPNPAIYDFWAAEYQQPTKDPQQDAQFVSGTMDASVMTIEFTRPLVSGQHSQRADNRRVEHKHTPCCNRRFF